MDPIELRLPNLHIRLKTADDHVRLLQWVDDVARLVERTVHKGIEAGLREYAATVAQEVGSQLVAAANAKSADLQDK